MTSPAKKWLDEMRQIWLEKRPDDIGALLSDKGFEYYEDPFQSPLLTKQAVIDAWQEILNQNIDFVEIDILEDCSNIVMAQWRFKMHDLPLHVGGYFLRLDDCGKCTEFRQWWTVG